MTIHQKATVRAAAVTVAAVAILLLSGCAGKPVVTDVERHPASIAIIPVLEAEEVSLDRDTAWLMFMPAPGLVQLIDRLELSARRKDFEAHFDAARKWIGPEITAALRDAGEKRGYRTVVLDTIVRAPGDPEDFDYPKIATDADIVIHVRVKTIGLHSPRFSNDYQPRLDLSVLIVAHQSGRTLVDDNFHYGVNATREGFWSVPADARYRFPDFKDVVENVALVDESWRAGAKAVGARIVEQIGTPLTR